MKNERRSALNLLIGICEPGLIAFFLSASQRSFFTCKDFFALFMYIIYVNEYICANVCLLICVRWLV